MAAQASGRHVATPGASYPVRSASLPTLAKADPATPLGSPRFSGLRAPEGASQATSPHTDSRTDAAPCQSNGMGEDSTAGTDALGNPGMGGSLECRASATTAPRPAPRASQRAIGLRTTIRPVGGPA